MRILAIETSCDETAVSIVEASGGLERPSFKVLAHTVHSQIDLHALYGGVVPMLAKREHAKQLTPLLRHALAEAGLTRESETEVTASEKTPSIISADVREQIKKILERE